METLDAIKQSVTAYCQQASDARRKEETVRRCEHEIRWLEHELATKKLSPRCRGEYRHQIRHKELEIAFYGPFQLIPHS